MQQKSEIRMLSLASLLHSILPCIPLPWSVFHKEKENSFQNKNWILIFASLEKEQSFTYGHQGTEAWPQPSSLASLLFPLFSVQHTASFQSLKCNLLPTCTGPLHMLFDLPEVPSSHLPVNSYFPFRIQINHLFLHLKNSY